jgi:hypothetical protein
MLRKLLWTGLYGALGAAATMAARRAASGIWRIAATAADGGGVKAKLADELREDAAFLRKLKPSLMVARAKGEAPKDQPPGAAPTAPGGPQLGERPEPKKRRNGGPNPFVVVGVALAGGILFAKWLDWRGHAHPRH